MERRYRLDGRDLVQIHPQHGVRKLVTTGGAGQSVRVGEVGGVLLRLELWRCMGDTDGELTVQDPDGLQRLLRASLDDPARVGIWGELLVVCDTYGRPGTWRAWRRDDWEPVEPPAVTPASVLPLSALLTDELSLPPEGAPVSRPWPRTPPAAPEPSPPAPRPRAPKRQPPFSEAERADLARRVLACLHREWPDAEVTGVELRDREQSLELEVATPRPGLLIGRRGATAAQVRARLRELIGRPFAFRIREEYRPTGPPPQ